MTEQETKMFTLLKSMDSQINAWLKTGTKTEEYKWSVTMKELIRDLEALDLAPNVPPKSLSHIFGDIHKQLDDLI